MKKLLLLSSSRVGSTPYLSHAEHFIKSHLGDSVTEVLFIPYAGVTIDYDQYESMVSDAFKQFGYSIKSIHHFDTPKEAIEQAQAIAVGGGNTFCLLNELYQQDLIQSIRDKVNQGTPYIGWSAGSNVSALSIRTTNDMPIVEPPSFEALKLLPFQINPHYIEGNPPGHNGETREQRIDEFLVANPDTIVVAIPEGTALKCSGDKLNYIGDKTGFLFTSAKGKQTISSNEDLSRLL